METLQAFAQELFTTYNTFACDVIPSCYFTQSEMLQWIQPYRALDSFRERQVGTSAEGRPLTLYSIGTGPTSILLWSQMHGDEPTATMALIDIMSWFMKNSTHPKAHLLQERLTIHMVPMLNPDGAERFSRRTAYNIDLNRDAQSLKTPEARILKHLHDSLRPTVCFNLHDQDPRLTVGTTKKFTALALLAPAFDETNSDSPTRLRAKRVASLIATVASEFIPGHIARWNDTYEPRAFGESIQQWGTSIILLESGGWKNDPYKFFLRKMNTVVLLSSFFALATGEYQQVPLAIYETLPVNAELGFDYIVRNALYSPQSTVDPIRIDVGLNIDRIYKKEEKSWETIVRVMDMGDLTPFIAYEEIDGTSRMLNPQYIRPEHEFPYNEFKNLFL